MSKTLISIIIPTYNRAKVIEETLASIVKQTYTNWECIIIDDGSTDHTEQIISNYLVKDQRIRFFKRSIDRPKGANACRNQGLEYSKGEYVQFFDSDDLMHPDKIKVKLNLALKFKADIIIDDHSSDLTSISKSITNIDELKFKTFQSSNFYMDFILNKVTLITNDVMLRKEIIKKNRFDERLQKGQEFDFLVRIFNQNINFCIVHENLTYYRDSEDSISSVSSVLHKKKQDSLILINKKLQEEFPDNILIQERAKKHLRKVYRNLIKQKKIGWVIENYKTFKDAYELGYIKFTFFVVLNFLTNRGFDQMKP